jgi:hypothetical protein
MTEKLMLTSTNDVALPPTARWLKMKVLRTILCAKFLRTTGVDSALPAPRAAPRAHVISATHGCASSRASCASIMCIIARLPSRN